MNNRNSQVEPSCDWRFWRAGETLKEIVGVTPLLACWESKSHPTQIRHQAYLADVQQQLGELPREGLALHMDVDVGDQRRLERDYDLENYLTPIICRFGPARFVTASARKYVGGGSRIRISNATLADNPSAMGNWSAFSCQGGSGCQKAEWKHGIRDALRQAGAVRLPQGQVEAQIAWKCAPSRNWAMLWKPTGDAMGPVLGEPDSRNPFNPNDDRIVSIAFHLNADSAMGHNVDVGMWWRMSP